MKKDQNMPFTVEPRAMKPKYSGLARPFDLGRPAVLGRPDDFASILHLKNRAGLKPRRMLQNGVDLPAICSRPYGPNPIP